MTEVSPVLTGEWWRWRRGARTAALNPPGRAAPGNSRPASPASGRNCVYSGVEKPRCRSLSGPDNSPCCTRSRALSSFHSCSRCSCSTVNSLWDRPILASLAVCTSRCTCSGTCRSNLKRVFATTWIKGNRRTARQDKELRSSIQLELILLSRDLRLARARLHLRSC